MGKKKGSKKNNQENTGDNQTPVRDWSLCNADIGDAAGEVWRLLAESGEQSLSKVKKSTSAPADITLAAVGWLAREDKLQFHRRGRSIKLVLR